MLIGGHLVLRRLIRAFACARERSALSASFLRSHPMPTHVSLDHRRATASKISLSWSIGWIREFDGGDCYDHDIRRSTISIATTHRWFRRLCPSTICILYLWCGDVCLKRDQAEESTNSTKSIRVENFIADQSISITKMPPKSTNDDGTDFLAYLKSLPTEILDSLYDSSATCLAICRYLPPMAQQFIMRLLFVEQPIPLETVENWIMTPNRREARESISNMKSLSLLIDGRGGGGLILSSAFRKGLKDALFSGKPSGLKRVDVEEKHRKTIPELEQYAVERWECILRYMALPSNQTEKAVSSETRGVLQSAGFVKGGEDERLEITSRGFQYLLLDRRSQLWSYLLSYLKFMESKNMDIVKPISFLFHLSFCTLGQAYSSENVGEAMLDFLQHLRETGLVNQRKRTSGFFYPTPLALSLAIGRSGDTSLLSSGLMKSKGFVVVETNFRVYAYTDSALQLAIVSTFTDMTYRFGNMSVGILTRESVRRSFTVGITANQIIDYLRTNAHDQMLKESPTVPPTITDQIRLWELERDRFIFDEGVLYSNFMSDEEFTTMRNYARQIDALTWENDRSRTMVVTPNGHEQIKQWKNQKGSK